MDFYRRLAWKLALVLAIPALMAWIVVHEYFPLTREQSEALDLGLPLAVAIVYAVTFLAAWRLSAPLRTALGPRRSGATAAAAAACGYRLPGRLAAVVFVLAAAALAGLVGMLGRMGLSPDVAAAGASVGGAVGILAGMLVYSVAGSSSARAIAELGPGVEFHEKGTVRGKILAFGYGLLTIAAVPVGAVSYVRFRVDSDAEYVHAAERAQEAALAVARGEASSAAAELVTIYLLPQHKPFKRPHKLIALAASIAIVAVIAGRSMNDDQFKSASVVQVAQQQLPEQPSTPVVYANQAAQYPLNKRINDYLQAHNSSVYTNGEANFQPYARVTAYSQK